MRLLLAATAAAFLSAPAFAQTPPAAPAKSDLDKMVCKRTPDTGSLVRGKKICMTRREWSAQAATAQAEMTRTVGAGSMSQ